jgi:transformation/transcription domain-associated protein
MKIHALKVMNLLIDIIRHDNEESVIICFKLVVDLYRASKAFLESTVAPFFQTIMEMYGLVPATVEEIFGDITTDKNQPDGIPISPDGATHLNPDPSKAVPDSGKGNLMRRTASGNPNVSGNVPLTGSDSTSCEAIRGMKSFRALQECPVAVVFLLQTYKATVVPSLPACLPLIFKVSAYFFSAPHRCSISSFCLKDNRVTHSIGFGHNFFFPVFENICSASSYVAWDYC